MKRLLPLFVLLLCLFGASPVFAVQQLEQSGSTAPIPFLLLDSATGQIGQTGQASNCTVTVCKPGTTSYVASSGTITELGNGLYNYAPTTVETGSGTTDGFLLLHITDTTDSAQVVDVSVQIVAFNPNDATLLGLTNVATLSAQSSQTTTLGTVNTNLSALPSLSAIKSGLLINPSDPILTNGSGYVTATNGGSGGVTDSSVQTDVQTAMTGYGYTSALASNLATTNTDVPLIYTQTAPNTYYITAANTIPGTTSETLTAKQWDQLKTSEVIGDRNFAAASGSVQTGVIYLAGYGTTYPVEDVTINTTTGEVVSRTFAQPFPTEP